MDVYDDNAAFYFERDFTREQERKIRERIKAVEDRLDGYSAFRTEDKINKLIPQIERIVSDLRESHELLNKLYHITVELTQRISALEAEEEQRAKGG